MHDCSIDGVDYLTDLTKWASIVQYSIVSRPLSWPGTTNAATIDAE